MARTIFKDANVLDGDRPAQPGTTVVVEGNRIIEVSTQPVGVQPDDVVHDLRGYTIMPGLGMGHFHAEFHHMDMNLLPHVYNGAERPTGVLMAVAITTCRTASKSRTARQLKTFSPSCRLSRLTTARPLAVRLRRGMS